MMSELAFEPEDDDDEADLDDDEEQSADAVRCGRIEVTLHGLGGEP